MFLEKGAQMDMEVSSRLQSEKPRLPTTKMPEIIVAPPLADYMDYRKFLSDWYQHRRFLSKRDLRPYSYAMFSAGADIKSPNYLKMIIEGRRNLSEEMIMKFSRAMSFNKEQSDEFRLMVLFDQAHDPAARNFFLKELSDFRVQQQLRNGQIDKRIWEKIPNWITWILYAMFDQNGVEFQPQKLRELLRGKANEVEIEDALKTLMNSGEVVRDEVSGQLRKSRNLVDTPDEVPVALVRKLQSQLMYLGLESLFQDSPAEREFGSLTMSLTHTEFDELRFKLRQMRKQLHKDNSIKRMTNSGDRVYQLNLQLFPVTNEVKK